jgi:hypothetical protein
MMREDMVEAVVFYMTIPAALLALAGVILDLLPWRPPGGRAWRLVAQLALAVVFSVAALDPSRQYWWRALVYGVVALGVVMGGGLRAATPGSAQQRAAL